ncbi:hypothetical protein M501DRAFT_1032758 [Patellaria atrata CBS 101060]|uniref:Uncharacterized protein n=1 Tax=Patellaria atrata CBS 101060 TaxID=1346257 RepID=A0A9P4VRG8_9PEZI|nr:hypothetical protein M501DRAFT_1032758 [Patellaria atrata CBS 101060]
MGICASCLGLQSSEPETSDTQHLLSDPYQPQYGSNDRSISQPDQEEIRRQRDALERICAQTSDNLIDVSQAAVAEDGAIVPIIHDFERLFREHFPPRSIPQTVSKSRPSSASSTPLRSSTTPEADEARWIEANLKISRGDKPLWDEVKHGSSPLVLRHFGDAASPDLAEAPQDVALHGRMPAGYDPQVSYYEGEHSVF